MLGKRGRARRKGTGESEMKLTKWRVWEQVRRKRQIKWKKGQN